MTPYFFLSEAFRMNFMNVSKPFWVGVIYKSIKINSSIVQW